MHTINVQPIEKIDHRPDGSLAVHSIFGPTIQGEGPLTGHPAYFVRLAGCNLQCPGCDTTYTGPEVQRMTPEGIMGRLRALPKGPRLVVISGGEPFRQDIGLLTMLLEDEGYEIQVETNGTLPPPFMMAASTWVVVSPKTGRVHPRTVEVARAWKYVLDAGNACEDDGLPMTALDHTAAPRLARPPADWPLGAVYVQPADRGDADRNIANTQAVLHTCLRHGYTFQLQIHKLIGVE